MAGNGGLTFKPPKAKKYGNSGGGVAYNPNLNYGGGAPPTLLTPPAFTFDPALAAQQRQAQRGLEDTEADVKKDRKWENKDWRLKRRDITTATKRDRFDLNRGLDRGNEDLNTREANTKLDAQRSREDFQTRLNGIARQFGDLAHRQGEAQNAAGVNDQGTSAAAAAARARNQLEAEEPIRTAQQRLEEDLVRSLTAIGTDRTRLGENYDTSMNRLIQDRDRSRLLTNIQHGRKQFDLKTELQRARREGAITEVDLMEQMIWQAKENHPGAFKKWAAENPDIMAMVNGAAGGKPGTPKPALGRNIVAPPPKKQQQKKKGKR